MDVVFLTFEKVWRGKKKETLCKIPYIMVSTLERATIMKHLYSVIESEDTEALVAAQVDYEEL